MVQFPAYTDERSESSTLPVGLVDIAFFLLLLMAVTAPLVTDTAGLSSSSALPGMAGEGNLGRQFVYIVIFLAILYGIGAQRDLRILKSIPPALCAVLAVCWLSVAWAIDPVVALRRIALTTVVVISVSLAVKHLGKGKVFFQLHVILLMVCALNYIAVIFVPKIGIHQAEAFRDAALIGNWRGIFPEKNYTGMLCATTIIIVLFSAKYIKHWISSIIVVAVGYFLWNTASKTSIAVVIVAIIAGLMFMLYNQRYRSFLFIGIALIFIMILIYSTLNWDQIVAPLDQDDTLTGRSQIWRLLISYIDAHWMLGSGYGSFWNIGKDSPLIGQIKPGSWIEEVSSGHNGYLDIAAQIGIPGLVLVVYAMLIRPFVSLLVNPIFNGSSRALYIALMVFYIGHNWTESTILDRDQFLEVLLVATICLIYFDRTAGKASPGDAHSRVGGLLRDETGRPSRSSTMHHTDDPRA